MSELPPPFPSNPQNLPPLPPAVINYARPMPQVIVSGKPNFAQQAAKFSWAAPIVAVALSACSGNVSDRDRITSMVIGGVCCTLLLAGLVFGVLALFGIRKYGREKVLVPAIIGVSINGLFVLSMIGVILVAFSQRTAAIAARRAAVATNSMTTAQLQDDALFGHDGWVGAVRDGKAVVTLLGIATGSQFDGDFQRTLPTPCQVLVLSVDNSANDAELNVNLGDVRVFDLEGKPLGKLSPKQTTDNLIAATQLMPNVGGHVKVEPHRPTPPDLFIFVPRGLDLRKVSKISVGIDGQHVAVPGSVITSAQKRKNRQDYDAAKEKTTTKTPQTPDLSPDAGQSQ